MKKILFFTPYLLSALFLTACGGNNGTSSNGSPSQGNTSGGDTFSQISVGTGYVCGIKSGTGIVTCLGHNSYGQLGNGTTSDSATPVQVNNISSFKYISAGALSACGITTDGSAYCWGDNQFGELGAGTNTNSLAPIKVTNITNFTSISVGTGFVCGLTTDGSAYCWGANGAPDATNSNVPVKVTFQNQNITLKKVAAGQGNACALTDAGDAWCWGSNVSGQLGNGSDDPMSSVPILVSNGSSFTDITASTLNVCGVKSDGTAWCWGSNQFGELGNGQSRGISNTPVQVLNSSNFKSISNQTFETCGRKSDGTVWCWGFNSSGQLGNGTQINSSTPVQVSNITNFESVSVGSASVCGLSGQGQVWCWGGSLTGGADSSVPVNLTL